MAFCCSLNSELIEEAVGCKGFSLKAFEIDTSPIIMHGELLNNKVGLEIGNNSVALHVEHFTTTVGVRKELNINSSVEYSVMESSSLPYVEKDKKCPHLSQDRVRLLVSLDWTVDR